MSIPIFVTIPFGDLLETTNSQEARRYEAKLIQSISANEMFRGIELNPSHTFFAIYPYRNANRRGEPLLPSQLRVVLKEQAGLFLPEIKSAEAFNEYFFDGSRTKIQQKYADDLHETWDDCRIVIVADDLACNYVKVFEVSQHDFFARNARRILNTGESLRIEENDQYLIENAKSEEREDGSVGCGMEEHENASHWLGLPSEQFCAVNGISATFMPTEMLTSNINDLLLGNASFFDFVLEYGEVDEARMIKALEQLKET